MSRKNTIDAIFGRKTADAAGLSGERGSVRTGAVAAMGASLQHWTENAKKAAQLQDQMQSGMFVLELDPGVLDHSIVTDRIEIENDPSFQSLVESIRASGQQLPILVRPHPTQDGRYQVAYGHRRLRAAAALGIKIRAIVRALTDAELVIAQGKENLDRHDLTFIEKALFARRLEDKGFDRHVIIAALSSDKADVSRYIAIARDIPESVVLAIGSAPKTGRARWSALAELMKAPAASRVINRLIEQDQFKGADSDGRFGLMLSALTPKRPSAASSLDVADSTGKVIASFKRRGSQTQVIIDDRRAPDFGEFVVEQLPTLFEAFAQGRAKQVQP